MSEIELKFLVDKQVAKKLRARLRAESIDGQVPKSRRLHSVYFDTPDQALHNAGFSVRLRRDGRRWIQTVKTRAPMKNGLSSVEEFECDVPRKALQLDAIENKSARKRVVSLAEGKPLAPVCETAMKRMSGVVSDGNGTLAEISVDSGKIIAGERSVRFYEAEIELQEGRAASLYRLAGELLSDEPFSFSRLSKSDRGYLLASDGRIDVDATPRNAKRIPLDGGQSARSACQAVFRECLEQISTNIDAIRASDDPEGPHQLRVGLRRLRSALELFAPTCERADRRFLRKEARWLGRKVSELRDRDVAIIDIIDPAAADHPQEKGFAVLKHAVTRDAAKVRKKVRKKLNGQRAQAFLLETARICEMLSDADEEPRVLSLIQSDLESGLQRACELGDRIETLSIEERHELRKNLKRLRYAVEFSAPIYGNKPVSPFVKRLKSLQTVFGELNDVAMIEELFSDQRVKGCGGKAAQRAIGLMIGGRLAKAQQDWTRAKALWGDFVETDRFWR